MKKNILIIGAIMLTSASFALAKGGVDTVAAENAVTTCSPVKALKYKGDANVNDSSLTSIAVSYSVSPCDAATPIRIGIVMKETAPGTIVYEDTNASASGKFTVFGVKRNTSYYVTVTVYNATTGEVLGTSSIFAAANYKGV